MNSEIWRDWRNQVQGALLPLLPPHPASLQTPPYTSSSVPYTTAYNFSTASPHPVLAHLTPSRMSTYYQYPGSQPSESSADPALQFYSQNQQPSFYAGRPSLDQASRSDVAGAIGSGRSASGSGFGGAIVVHNWWNAFTPWTGTEGEPPLLEGESQELSRGCSWCSC
jgi:hypothetical protein